MKNPRRTTQRLALVTAALTPGLLLAGTGSATAAPNANNSAKIQQAVTVEGVLEHLRALEAIGDRNAATGYRQSGTPGYDQSAQYVYDRLVAAGYSPRFQEFSIPYFRELAPGTFERTAPTARTYTPETEFTTFTYSPAGDLTGNLVPVDINLTGTRASTSGCEASDFAGFPAGSIALVQRGTCNFSVKIINAQAAGATGVVIFNQGNTDTRLGVVNGTLGGPDFTIPVVGTSFAIGQELAQAGTQVRIVTRTISATRTTRNVIAETAGRTDQVLVVGAHLDSTEDGPAINDDGTGSAAILEIAEAMAKTKPNNQVRFIWFGAEEFGLLGSEYYVDTLPDAELAKIKAMLNFDMLGSSNWGRFVYDADDTVATAGSTALQRLFEGYFAERSLPTRESDLAGSSDYQPFLLEGIPVGGLSTGAGDVKTAEQQALWGGTAGVAFDPQYHTPRDRVNVINTFILDQMVDAAAHAVITLAYDLTSVGGQRVPGKSHGQAKAGER